MTKEDKIIKDLKKRNDSLLHQFDMTRMREISFSNKCERLKEENTKLKKELEITTFNFQSLSSACGSLAEFMGLDKDAIIEEMIDKVVKDRKEKDTYKSVLKEIRECINHEWFKRTQLGIIDKSFQEWQIIKLLEIIDKGLKNDE